jgi:hypothetical protein
VSVETSSRLHALLVASEALLAAWSARVAGTSDVVALAERDLQHALDVVVRRRPQVVVVEQGFASTARGSAFLQRLRRDPELPPVEVRVLSPEQVAALVSPHPPVVLSASALVALAQPVRGRLRRAARVRVPSGVEAQVDGAPASLVDVSVLGAQVVTSRTLKPNQRVRLQLVHDGNVVRAIAGVAWSSLELPKGRSPQYRAGIEFSDADPDALEAFYAHLVSSAPAKGREP